MRATTLGVRRIVDATRILQAATSLPVGAQTTAMSSSSACAAGPPVLLLANPSPGDMVPQGDLVVSGAAFDPNVSGSSGVSRVDLFLGQRDAGGVFLGSAIPGQSTPANGREFEVNAPIA